LKLKEPARLIIFTRYPEAGRTKTRLIPALGAEGAAQLQRKMTELTLATARRAQKLRPFDIEVRYQGGTAALMMNWLGSDLSFRSQTQGHIGQRMGDAFQMSLEEKTTEQAIIIGCDIPGITPGIICQAFQGLEAADLVFGPATDGGYYLIGVSRYSFPQAYPVLSKNIPWGTAAVLSKTLKVAQACHLSYTLVATLSDVDRPEDLKVWREFYRRQSGKKWLPRESP
jgi:rSAM/selenodomain-associated transferase 1